MAATRARISGVIAGTTIALAALWAAPCQAGCLAGASCATAPSPPAAPAAPASLSATLDGGFQDWLAIAPHAGYEQLPAEPLTAVGPTQSAPQKRPPPQTAEVPLDLYLNMDKPAPIRHDTVAGSANHPLWFAPDTAK